MSEPFLGEIRAFAFGRVPRGWAACEGQTMPINRYQALFSIIGVTYGGDGMSTFVLPDLRGRVPVHAGSGMAGIRLGQRGGEATHALTQNEIPAHGHVPSGSTATATVAAMAAGSFWAAAPCFSKDPAQTVPMSGAAVSTAGASQPHENMQPYAAVSFCIALNGIYPTRP